MKKSALIILSLIIAFTASATQHKHKKKHRPANQIISVSMRRTACYGRCPDYTIEINKDGVVTYTGKRFTKDTGTFKKNIGSVKAIALIGKFNTYRVDTCQDNYVNRISDLPGIIMTIQYGNHTKTIMNAHFGPGFLKELAGEMDAVGNKTDDEGWKREMIPAKR